MVALLSIGSVGTCPRRVRCAIGTWMAMVCTLAWASESTPSALAVGIRCSDWNGRSVARSNTEPRSTKNAVGPLAGEHPAAARRRSATAASARSE